MQEHGGFRVKYRHGPAMAVVEVSGLAFAERAEAALQEIAAQTRAHGDRRLLINLMDVVGTMGPQEHQMTQHPKQDPSGAPWWLQGGDEECPHCGQRYHLEVERRCAGCDAPSCAHCLSEPDRLCPGCAAEARG